MALYVLPVGRLAARQRRGEIQLRWRNGVLIAFSLLFYAWGEPTYVFLMFFTVGANYFFALWIERAQRVFVKKSLLIAAAVLNLGLLGVFKYTRLAVHTINLIPGVTLPVPGIVLPIGISFYTFQVFAYVIDVYRGEAKAQRSFPRLLLFVTLFHQLVAGPIVRYAHVEREIGSRHTSPEQMSEGIARFLTGLAKKAVLANICGELAGTYLNPAGFGKLSVLGAWLGILTYSMQIYFDFSAYSDMAIGMGRMIGFHYHENFNYPYAARSVTDFWRRWHMSLGSFFRDYVYIPLGGNRSHQVRNLFIVWALTGLWHGASWNFVLWGLYYFAFLVLEKFVLRNFLAKLPRVASHLYLLLVVVVGWVFFYYENLRQAFALLGRMFGVHANGLASPDLLLALKANVFFLLLAALACAPVLPWLKQRLQAVRGGPARAALFAAQCAVLAALLAVSTIQLAGGNFNPFIYYRF
ncbi:MAG: MBOAT family protein [Oscillospiraceae bacterium]|jgi:alginate O-acetyltransferase complex protein AlgI|nr:MBOAT family protein [Oscillospiraceae bacterium]